MRAADLCAGITCQAPEGCESEAGACDPATGQCGAAPKLPDGSICFGGACQGGICTGGRTRGVGGDGLFGLAAPAAAASARVRPVRSQPRKPPPRSPRYRPPGQKAQSPTGLMARKSSPPPIATL